MTSCRGVILGKTSHVSGVYLVLFSFISGYKNAGSQTKSRLSAGGNMIILQLKKIVFKSAVITISYPFHRPEEDSVDKNDCLGLHLRACICYHVRGDH